MKTWTIMLTAGFVLAAIPFVTAEESCTRADATQAIAHPDPAKKNSYIFFDITQPQKVGEWVESNGAGGLQTMICFTATGRPRYAADTQAPLLG